VATASVLAQALLRGATRLVAAGADPMRLRPGIERGVAAAAEALAAQAVPAAGQDMLSRLATGVTGDPELGALLGEMFDILGVGAALLVEEFAAPHLDREYLDGGRWRARPAARALMPEGTAELTLDQPLVLVIDQKIDHLGQVQAALELAVRTPGRPALLLVARGIGGEALSTLTLNHARGALTIGAAIVTTSDPALSQDLDDIALMTGGQVLADLLGRPPQAVRPAYFGRARRATLSHEHLTIVGGSGDSQAIQQRVAELRGRVARLEYTHHDWERLRMRAARLAGGVGIIKVGAYTTRARDIKKELVKKALCVLAAALEEGLVPGGGVAYLNCRPAVLAARARCADADEAAGVGLVAAALDAPFAQIVSNHGGVYPPLARAEIERLGPGFGFDTLCGRYVSMADIGVLDSLSVTRGALRLAASTAVMASTTELVVLRPRQRRAPRMRP
jgi:chaperonin GroEL